ncbi:MAG: MBL fold metallo-hydrolase [Proteobacteria bacterium]|nr:MBL fold metallo-hydrolase [Pseudomonadota bacterium]
MQSPIKAVIVPVTPFQQNCSVVWCAKTGIGAVVDPGGDLDQVLAAAESQNVRLEKILVTHGHIDHAGNVQTLADRLGLPIEGPQPEDSFWIDQLEDQGTQFGIAGAKIFTPDRWLSDGEVVTVGDAVFGVHHCPGHTPGHVIFHHAEAGVAFVGDVIFRGSIGRSDFPRGDHATLIASITNKLWPLGDDVTFVPVHTPTTTFGFERANNPFVGDHVLQGRR